ncbi:ankyrin repeat-containing domain protein [Bipolaris maydis]|nr:ankyrin repeat-containing domain protein [Bipolaris maydis]
MSTQRCITRILLEAGANVSPDGSCKSALHHAIDGLRCTPSLDERSITAGVQTLLMHGADPNYCTRRRKTPLHLASKAGNHVWVKVLIEYGANVGRTDDSGLNALHYAAQSGNHKTIVAILRTEEAKKVGLVTSKDGSGRNVLHHLLDKKKKARIKTIRFLLSRGADSSAVDDSGCTPLASYLQSRSYINPELCSLLLKFNGNATFSNSKGQNLGHLYIQNRNTTFETLRFLHERGVDLTKKDHEEKTLLHVAATRGSLTDTMLVYLINVVGLGIADQDIHGRDVLQYATERHERIERVEIELSAMFCMEELSVDFCSCSCSGCSGFYRNFYRDSYRDSRLTILRRITELKELATKRNNVTIPVL